MAISLKFFSKFLPGFGFQDYLDGLRLSVRVCAEVKDTGVFRTFGQVVFPIACSACDGEAFDVIISELTVPVYDVVNRPVVVTLKYVDI